MPYLITFVPASLVLAYRGVSVYHTYRNDEVDQGERTFRFVLDPEHGESEAFDVRDLLVPSAQLLRNDGNMQYILTVLQDAIRSGLLGDARLS